MSVSKIETSQVSAENLGGYEAVKWRLELYCDEGTMFPVGTAYVVELKSADDGALLQAQLNFIWVADQWRNRGYAGALLKECKSRWPGLQSTSRMK